MRYLSLDLEATGLAEDDLIIEIGIIPFCTESRTLEHKLALHSFIQCPSFETLKPRLDQWVIDHNETLIRKAHLEGEPIEDFKFTLTQYLESKAIKEYFKNDRKEKIILFGKSMNAIDLPFLNRDLGWNYMREHFHHRVLDLSSSANTLIDLGHLPPACSSGSELMKTLGMGDVAHTALEDAKNTALMYLKMLELFSKRN